jgi:hypothetical protein
MTVVVVLDRSNRTAFVERAINDFALPAAERSAEYPQSSRIEINLGGPLAGDLQEQDGRKKMNMTTKPAAFSGGATVRELPVVKATIARRAMKPNKTMVRNLGLPEAKVNVWPDLN